MNMEFSADIVEMLGTARVEAVEKRLTAIRACVASAPDHTCWVKHVPIALRASDRDSAERELIERLRKNGPDWFYITAVRADGTHVGYASDLVRLAGPPLDRGVSQFFLFDIHSSLGGWWVSHVWRAADLAEATYDSLGAWLILPAATCVRAFLEGVAAFVIEGEKLLAEWSAFKQRGIPDVSAVMEFREQFHGKLLQAQFGSRLGERGGPEAPIKRTNVMTILEKFSKRDGCDVTAAYEWLCDAVHPSFGFQTAYVSTQGVHNSGATFAADLARRTHTAHTRISKIEPTVAWACVDAFIVAVDAFLGEVPRLRWLIDDFGLTTGVAFTVPKLAIGSISNIGQNSVCPCGSGLRFEECCHSWGTHATPLASAVS